MHNQITYRLNVKRRKDLLVLLIDAFPPDTLISFKGKLNGVLTPRHLYSEREQGQLERNTITPKLDFWVFRLDKETKDYLKKDFLNRIGVGINVIHILAAQDDLMLFASYDSFHAESVLLTQTGAFTDDFMRHLTDKEVIREFEKTSTVPNKTIK